MENLVKQINSEILGTEDNITQLILELRERHPTIVQIREDIATQKRNISNTESYIEKNLNLSENALEEINNLNDKIEAYGHQIEAITRQLSSDRSNQTLHRLKETLIGERRVLIENKQEKHEYRRETLSLVENQRRDLAEFECELQRLEILLADKLNTIEVSSEELDVLILKKANLNLELEHVDGIFRLIRDESIAHRVNHLDQMQQKIVGRIIPIVNTLEISNLVRFTDGIYGYVEVKKNNTWRGVCDDRFDRRDGIVICRMVGKNYVSHRSVNGPNSFWVDEVNCNGDEKSIFECGYTSNEDCGPGENVRVICE